MFLLKIARIYDPLNLILPVITTIRIMVQELWEIKCDWDDEVPPQLERNFQEIVRQLQEVENFKISRCVKTSPNFDIEVHGFGDASSRAIAACFYLRVKNDQPITTTLLIARGRLVPMKTGDPIKDKNRPCIAKLCAALIVSDLAQEVIRMLNISKERVKYWSDSKIALAWIAYSPLNLKTYVANRERKVQNLTEKDQWRFVSGSENPADTASRGSSPFQL